MALPCHAAAQMTTLDFPSVRAHPLEWIWYEAPAFNAFRGTAWLGEPCRSCPRRDLDFGGCRCQAFALTGDAARTDPVCHLSPDHHLIEQGIARARDAQPSVSDLVFRRPQMIGRALPTTFAHPA